MTRAHFFAAALLFSSSAQARTVPAPKAIVVIMLDAARSDHFSCYGYERRTTPNVDRLAARGAIFTDAFSPGINTVDAVSRIMSSRYRSRRFLSFLPQIPIEQEHSSSVFYDDPSRIPLLPDFFSAGGFLSAGFSNHPFLREGSALLRRFDEFQGSLEGSADVFSKARAWLEINRGKPRLTYIHVMTPHQPYAAPLVPEWSRDLPAQTLQKVRADPYEALRVPNGLSALRTLYDGELRAVDEEIGSFARGLEDSGLMEETMFVVTADHGERLGESGRVGHGGLPSDVLLRVPLLISFPPLIPGGVRVGGFVSTVDLLPTLASAVGLAAPSDIDGKDLMPAISAGASGRSFVLSDSYFRTADYKWVAPRESVSLLPIPDSSDPGQLFRLKDDPLEERDLAENEPTILNEMRSRFLAEIAPSLGRWEASRNSGPAQRPFFIFAGELASEPVSPWSHFRFGPFTPLMRMPGQKSLFLTLKGQVPSGSYQIEALVEYLGEGSAPELHTRSGRRTGARPDSWPIRILGERSRFIRFPLGASAVISEHFSAEVDIRCGEKRCALHALLFLPESSVPDGGNSSSAADMDEAYRSLRDAGYLRREP